MFRRSCLWALLSLALLPGLSFAQQTGAISGKVVGSDGLVIPGVTVEARSPSLPAPRVTVTGGAGEYRLPALQPGTYTLTFVLSGMNKVTKEAVVALQQDTAVNATLSVQGVTETVTVTAAIIPVIEKDSTALKSGVSTQTIQSVPLGQEYRDLVKLIPGVQYTEDSVRGPSAGGSGQDNVYKFDGVNVTLPLFGTLSAEPASYDVAQVTTIKGGAKAVDFDRSGGFTVDSVSKSGTAKFSGMLSYQFQKASMVAAVENGGRSQFSQDLTWLTANLGGPVIPNKAYFYASYYRPTEGHSNAGNLYGALPDFKSVRNEGFGKLTVTPISQMLVNISWRQSHRLDTGSTFGSTSSATTGSGAEAWQKIGIVELSWVANSRSFVTFKYTHFSNPNQSRPDYLAATSINTAIGTRIDTTSLDTIGQLQVPSPIAGATAYNAFIQPLVNQYGYLTNGVKTGGGFVGYGTLFDNDNFYRDQAQVGYNITLGTSVRHDIHAGLQWYADTEDLIRSSNGWGLITVPGGRLPSVSPCGNSSCAPAYYVAAFQQQSVGAVPTIHSEYRSINAEVNDTISFNNLSFNFGLLLSRDKLYGQGLQEDPTTISGYVAKPGNKYLMYTVPFSKTLQPRVGTTWSYNGKDTVYASFARYIPAASSLPRAASWARNLATTINAYFDANGVLYGIAPFASSSGKLFVPDMTPRRTDEFLVGTNKQFKHGITGRLYYRYRRGSHYWEDTNNNARVVFDPPAGIPRTLYIPNLTAMTNQIGSGSSYVITELDGAYTAYHEATAEVEWRTRKANVRLSYSWTRYRGNFDQDNTTSGNDANIFIGSSNIGDGAGRQLWNLKDGTLRGDRPLMLKLYGYYELPWNASAGAYVIVQSGQPWEAWSYEPYRALTTSTSDTDRFAEQAGSRRSPTHAQMDLNYTQTVKLASHYAFQAAADLYNVTNSQTGYNYEESLHSPLFGQPRSWFNPRRLQVSVRFQF
jgi:Carboxypeptidase regulatory-like domain